jgi:tetratricopeptide (TPR) repeat protein
VGDDPALKDVADGVVDAVSAKLFQLKNVYVASDTAAEAALKQGTPEKIAKNLGVTKLVQGTAQGGGNNISLVVSLDDIAGKRNVWKQEFSGSIGDLLTIENQIYSKLAASLALKTTNEEMARGATRLTSDIAAYQLYLRARNLLHGQQSLQNVTAALDLYNQAILKDPGFALAYAGVSDAAQRMYNLKNDPVWTERALGAAQQARALNDNLPEVHFALGSIYSKTGKTAEAIAELKRALELAPNSDEGYRRLGFAYLGAGNKDEALQAYQKAVDINPYYWLNYSHLGNAYFKFGRNEEALKAFQRMTELSPDSDVGYSNIGGVYVRMGRWNDAIPILQKAIDTHPSAGAYSNLGTAYFYLGNYVEAAKRFEKAVEMSPNHLRVGNLADAYRWMGQRDKANATYDRAIALALKAYDVNPRDVRTLENLSSYYAKKGDAKRAQDFIRRARAIDPNDNELMYYEGLDHALAGEKKEALQSLRMAFEHGYSAEEAKNDPELKGLQADPEFDKLLEKFLRRAK